MLFQVNIFNIKDDYCIIKNVKLINKNNFHKKSKLLRNMTSIYISPIKQHIIYSSSVLCHIHTCTWVGTVGQCQLA